MMSLVVDSSVLLKAYLPDEDGRQDAQHLIRDYAHGTVSLYAPSLISYEIANACLVASRMARLKKEKATELMVEMLGIELVKVDIDGLEERIFNLAAKYGRSAYDAAYVIVAESKHLPFFTADKKLYNTLKHHCPFVKRIEQYEPIHNDR
jgi:predicted nucleic acid-binding protein